jgi:2-oxoglutarate ferredoxin oxidoreductase subunit beta
MPTEEVNNAEKPSTVTPISLTSNELNDWCPGCGDSGIVMAVKNAIAGVGLDPHKTVIVSGIGCSSKLPHLVNVNGVHTLHGRPIPFAEGIKLANPELTVLIDSGDGDTYGIGAGHFVSAGRRNVDIKLFIHNNGVYALTKGQASPTLPEGIKVKGIPAPNINGPLAPLAIAIMAGYTFIARTQSYNVKEQTDLMIKAIKHKGLALIDIYQGCPTYNPEFTSAPWFIQHVKSLPQDYDGIVHNTTDMEEVDKKKLQALNVLLHETPDDLHSGLFFQWENQDTFEDRLIKRGIKSPIEQVIADPEGRSTTDLTKVFEDLSS